MEDLYHDSYNPVLTCLLLAVTYVLSLYIWGTNHHGDHPLTIKRRFVSVFLMSIVSAVFVIITKNDDQNLWNVIGLRNTGILPALILPLLLTMILFIGPLFLQYYDGIFKLYADIEYWKRNFRNLIWLRTHIVAPFSEELTFRACMLPILRQSFSEAASIFICPLFFGVAHLHHIYDRIRRGASLGEALLVSGFQFLYTTLFGMYSAFLFVRTGHLLSPFLIHAFCNHMGFPNFTDVLSYSQPKKSYLIAAFVIGLISWIVLLFPLTEPSLYGNS